MLKKIRKLLSIFITAVIRATNFVVANAATQTEPNASITPKTNLALHKPYTSSSDASASYPDTNGTELTDGIYTGPYLSDPAIQGRDSGSYTQTIDLQAKCSINEVTASFFENTGCGVSFPDNVSFSYSEDNINFNDIGSATPLEKVDLGGGVNSYSEKYKVALATPVTAMFVRMTVTDVGGWVFEDEMEVLGDKLAPANVALHKPYTSSSDASALYPDTNGTELTDGIYTGPYLSDPAIQGRDSGSYTQTIDLQAKCSINEVTASFFENTGCGVSFPDNVSFSYSEDNINFNDIGSATPLEKVDLGGGVGSYSMKYKFALASPVKARYIKIAVTDAGGWVFEDEAEILGYVISTAAPQEPVLINLSKGKPYTSSINASTDYPDTNGKELTDGQNGGPLLTDAAWQGRENVGSYIQTIDLRTKYNVYEVSTNFMQNSGSGIDYPESVSFAYSLDSVAYNDLGSAAAQNEKVLDAALGSNSKEYKISLNSAVRAQYIRMTVTDAEGWVFEDEMKVMGQLLPIAQGSFIQPDYASKLNDAAWAAEYAYMKEAGMNHIFIQWTANSKSKLTYYPTSAFEGYTQDTTYSSNDVVKMALSNATAAGIEVYMGLQLNEDWFGKYANDATWLNNEANFANELADDLCSKYGTTYSSTIKGWYLSFEVDNWNFGDNSLGTDTYAKWDAMVNYYNTIINHLHSLTLGKPVVISPFYNTAGGLSSANWQKMWEYILEHCEIDIIALQDGFGAGHVASRTQAAEWFQATKAAIIKARPSCQLWDDAENFLNYEPMDIKDWAGNMESVLPYVDNFTSFSYNHYTSPQLVAPGYHDTYVDYVNTGMVETVAPTVPTIVTASAIDGITIKLDWNASTDNKGVAGYKVYRDGVLVKRLYNTATTTTDGQLECLTTYNYAVTAYDFAGNESEKSAVVNIQTPSITTYSQDIALGKTYTASMPANDSYPDTGGTELTDGIYAEDAFTSAGWQGRATNSTYNFIVDFGTVQTINEVSSEWAIDDSCGIVLPLKVIYYVSDDGNTFAQLGEVEKPGVPNTVKRKKYKIINLNITGRYIKVEVLPISWTFIDEIEVWNTPN